MKLKNLRKKIRRLEKRLREGPKRLAKLKGILAATETAKAKKLAARAAGHSQKRRPAKKAKRKLNLSPERREQLAAAMRARWAAKREAAGANPKAA
jgi:hypothetical protein